jgi:hypothetical protein
MIKILQRQLDKASRIEEIKLEKEKEIENHRNNAIKAMIKKEKVQEALFVIAKSPSSKAAQELLKQFTFLEKEIPIKSEIKT